MRPKVCVGLYRYGFNGKENDNEVKGVGDQQDYGMRIYDPRVGRFLSVDPLTGKYPTLTPYQFASNRPIDGLDLDGQEFLSFHTAIYRLMDDIETDVIDGAENGVQSVTTERTIVETVYNNVPSPLQNEEKHSIVKVNGGPVTSKGRDWDVNIDGPILYEKGTFYVPPVFFGAANTADGSEAPTKSMNPVTPGNPERGDDINNAGSALGEDGAGVVANQFNSFGGITSAQNYENDNRKGFYEATHAVDEAIQKGIKNWPNPTQKDRDDLINFVTDGYLPLEAAEPFAAQPSTNDAALTAYEHFISVAYVGIMILNNKDVPIRPGTRDGLKDLMKKYIDSGGTRYKKDLFDQVLPKSN